MFRSVCTVICAGALVCSTASAQETQYDPCLSPERAVLELLDKAADMGEDEFTQMASRLMDHLAVNCQMGTRKVNELFKTMLNAKIKAHKGEVATQAYNQILNPEPYLGLYKRSLFAPQEWDMVALFGNSRNQASCLGALKAIQDEVDSSGEYRCVNLPEDWRKHSIDEVIKRSIRLDE